MIKYQNYKHYKLPITMNPLNYGKLITKIDELNLFIIHLTKTNIALITQHDLFNEVKFYKEGDLRIEYRDHKIDDSTFIRSLDNRKFSFKNGKLTIIQSSSLIVLILMLFFIFPDNHLNIALSLPLFFKRDLSKSFYSNT